MSTPCSVAGCHRSAEARGWCNTHYERWRKHGDVAVVKAADHSNHPKGPESPHWRGGRTIHNGYVAVRLPDHPRAGPYKHVPEHILVVERAIGHYLVLPAEVHHRDENRANNDPANLIVCENHGYHRLLHVRTDAYRATGNADSRKCVRCKRWILPDDPEFRISSVTPKTPLGNAYHRACALAYAAAHPSAVRRAQLQRQEKA